MQTSKHRLIGGAVGALLSAAALFAAGSASAEGYRDYKAQRDYVRTAPVKDCTRVNGRWGYYGNPWCTPAEQDRFDRWSAARWAR